MERLWYNVPHDKCNNNCEVYQPSVKLHKLLYLAQRESLVQHDTPLFAEGIYAYQYGPVVKEVRSALKRGTALGHLKTDTIPDDAKSVVDVVFDTYSDKNSWSLSRLTHAEYSWCHARRASNSGGGERLMPVDDIRRDAVRIRARRTMRLSMLGGNGRCKSHKTRTEASPEVVGV